MIGISLFQIFKSMDSIGGVRKVELEIGGAKLGIILYSQTH